MCDHVGRKMWHHVMPGNCAITSQCNHTVKTPLCAKIKSMPWTCEVCQSTGVNSFFVYVWSSCDFGLGWGCFFLSLSSFSSSAHAHGLIRALGLLKWSAQILPSLLHYDAGWTGWLFRPSWTQTKHWGCRFNTWEFGFVCMRMNRNTFPGFGDAFTHDGALRRRARALGFASVWTLESV